MKEKRDIAGRLMEPVSPLVVWYWLLNILMIVYLVDYWIKIINQSHRPWAHDIGSGAIMTGVFLVTNVLLRRNRFIAGVGFVICFLLMAFGLLPVL